jgi:hypothetical protein
MPTSRIVPRFMPVVRLYDRPTPLHAAFSYDAMASMMRAQGRVAPGRFTGVSWAYLRDEAQEFDGAPGMPRDFRPAALLLDYSIRWKNTGPRGTTGRDGSAWINESERLPDYAAIIDLHREQLLNDIAVIEAKEEAQRSDEEKEQLDADLTILDELRSVGYLRTGFDLFGTKCTGLFWGATLAPARVRSGFTLEKDGSFTIGLERWEPPRELFRHTYWIEFGRGVTWYALQIGDDGNGSTFYHFRNMPESQRDALRAELETVLDRGRLTVEDHRQLLELADEEQAIRARAKLRERAQNAPVLTDEDSADIERLQAQAQVIRDSKRGLVAEDEDLKRDLENRLFIAKQDFSLIESARTLLGRPVTITFRFLKSGFVEIASDAGKSGKGRWLYENKRITGLNPPRYQSGLPDKCHILLKSDGGKWALTFGHPLHHRLGSLWSQPFTIPFEFDGDEVQFEWEGDASFAGCAITASLEVYRAAATHGNITIPALYQVKINLHSDAVEPDEAHLIGRGTPELYWLELHVPAGEYAVFGEPVWDSESPETWDNGVRRIQDVTLRCEDVRSMACDVLIADSGGTSGLPLSLAQCACDVALIDRWDEDSEWALITSGMIATLENRRVKSLDGSDGIEATPDVGFGRALAVIGCENFLTSEIEARISGHNKYPNDYLRQIALDAGLHPDLILWDSGNIGAARINKAKPGDYPSCKPAPGIQYLEWMRDVVRNHMPGWALVSTEGGLDLVRLTGSRAVDDRPELAFNIPPTAAIDSPLCLRNEFHLRQDTRGYVTRVTAIGAINPLTGMRFVATESLPQAHDERFADSMYYIGREIAVTLPVDESLTSHAACIKRAREELFSRGRPPHFGTIEIDYDVTLRPAQQPRIFGIKFLITSVGFGALAAGNGGMERMTVEVQLNEDRRPTV